MSAQPHEEPARGRLPDGQPARRRRTPPPSPYDAPGGMPQPNAVELPPGYRATVEPPVTSDGFIGGAFTMDSLEFLRWAAKYFHNDLAGLRILVFLMGSQEVGGTIRLTQQAIGAELNISRPHVTRVFGKLAGLGVVWMRQRGNYQLNPAGSLRGGTKPAEPAEPTVGRRTRRKGERVDQLSLLTELVNDPDVPKAFRKLAEPDPTLPPPPPRARRKSQDLEEK
ncbi:helix-turn-helix domain-containing protein [Streptomyces sp. 8N706]|uniref:helix-turn-helix domain-containing protein n=1 Tax=Streptomyces sp. 8N706 TaxID=3457416 RepID=UPI003FD35C3E